MSCVCHCVSFGFADGPKRHFINSAYWTFTALDVARLEVRFCSVSARVDQAPYHDLGNLDAFNTDGTLAVLENWRAKGANQIF